MAASRPNQHGYRAVSTKWSTGNLQYLDVNGNVIFTVDATNREITFPSGATLNLASGSVMNIAGQTSQGEIIAKVAANGGTDTAGGIFAWVAPFACFVTRAILNVTTVATGACTLDIGATASSATTLSDNLIDGQDTHSATGAFDNYTAAGSNGKAMQLLASGNWVTGSTASGASAGQVAFVYIFFTPV